MSARILALAFKVQLRPVGRLDAYQYDVAADGRFLLNTFRGEATSSGLTLVVNWPSTWSPAVRTAHRLVQEGAIGTVWEVKWRAGSLGTA